MKNLLLKIRWKVIFKVLSTTVGIVLMLVVFMGAYFLGILKGYQLGQNDTEGYYLGLFQQTSLLDSVSPSISPIPTKTFSPPSSPNPESWGGPDLWEEVNKRRIELGVNSLGQRDELCTIASIRLNQLLELDKLDAHVGFTNLEEQRPDLSWIFEKYSTIAEFLAQGGDSPQETVSLWENTLGHKKLLAGGEYVWGCIYAQNSFAVAITAF